MDTSFIFHPTYGARVSVFSASSHLLPPPAASPCGAILGTPTPSSTSSSCSSSSSLFPSFAHAPSPSRSRQLREETRARSSPPCLSRSLPSSPLSSLIPSRCFSLFLLFFVSCLGAPPSRSPALSAHFSPSLIFSSSLSVLTACLEYFGNYSAGLRSWVFSSFHFFFVFPSRSMYATSSSRLFLFSSPRVLLLLLRESRRQPRRGPVCEKPLG